MPEVLLLLQNAKQEICKNIKGNSLK